MPALRLLLRKVYEQCLYTSNDFATASDLGDIQKMNRLIEFIKKRRDIALVVIIWLVVIVGLVLFFG